MSCLVCYGDLSGVVPIYTLLFFYIYLIIIKGTHATLIYQSPSIAQFDSFNGPGLVCFLMHSTIEYRPDHVHLGPILLIPSNCPLFFFFLCTVKLLPRVKPWAFLLIYLVCIIRFG